jgi:hypothetical protein
MKKYKNLKLIPKIIHLFANNENTIGFPKPWTKPYHIPLSNYISLSEVHQNIRRIHEGKTTQIENAPVNELKLNVLVELRARGLDHEKV